jgi:ABC-type sugar transport system ATPase subunit
VATIADRLLTMRDGRIIDETRLGDRDRPASLASTVGREEQ